MSYNPFIYWLRLLQANSPEIPLSREVVPGVEVCVTEQHAEPEPVALTVSVHGKPAAFFRVQPVDQPDPRDELIYELNSRLMIIEPEREDALELLWDFLAFGEHVEAFGRGEISREDLAEEALKHYWDMNQAIELCFDYEMRRRRETTTNRETN